MKKISIIGIGVSRHDLTELHWNIIKNSNIIIGGKRQLELVKDILCEKKEINHNLREIVEFIKEKMQNSSISVLASGDPLFFGIGSFLVKEIGCDNILIYPNVSTLSSAFSKICESLSDVFAVSLHGRDNLSQLLEALYSHKKVAVFTDPKNNPQKVAQFLIENGFDDIKICVFEQIGGIKERINWYSPEEAKNINFLEPNFIYLRQIDKLKKKSRYIGMPDCEYEHENGLITKSEIRAVAISKLKLLPHHIVWDLGAGSGSVAIEASLMTRLGHVFAVEKNLNRIAHIQNNKTKFFANNLEIIHSTVPDCLDMLPKPDRIFIGGGGRNIGKIIDKSLKFLKNHGIIVISIVIISNLEVVLKLFEDRGFKIDLVQIQINQYKKMAYSGRFEPLNPVFIVSGEKV